MNLIDTSVWIEFFRGRPQTAFVAGLLEDDRVLLHPWVHGELLLGGLGREGEEWLQDFPLLPAAPLVPDGEVFQLLHARRLTGRGIGWVDAQLVASALVANARLWTFDRKLAAVADELAIGGSPVQ